MPPISNASRCRRSRTSPPRRARWRTGSRLGRARGPKGQQHMPIEIRRAALSPTMTEGNLARWLKKEGDEVHAGDVIAEIETDKATMEYEAADEGRIGKIIVPEGAQGIKVHEPIALLLEEGEDPAALEKFTIAPPSGNGRRTEAPAAPSSVSPKTEPAPAPPAQPAAAPTERPAPAQVN